MKVLFFCLIIFLSGCEEKMQVWFGTAKLNPNEKACAVVTEPENLKGKYCIRYEGEK